jgi:hypothetical protein
MEAELPFWEMEPADSLVTGAATIPVGIGGGKTVPLGPQVLAKPGEVYAIYYPSAAQTGTLDLSKVGGEFTLRWYSPRTGEFAGQPRALSAGSAVALGAPPSRSFEDWVALVRR